MKLSHTSEMAIHGLWELALANDGHRMLVSEIAERHQVSGSYLSKVFHKLGRAGIVVSRRGKVGGFTLARPASEISVGEIVRLFEGDLVAKPGSIRMPEENQRKAMLKEVLQDVENRIFDVLDNVSLADLQKSCPDTESPRLKRRKYTRREGTA